MIIGIGIDLVEIARIEKTFDKLGARFAHRILTDNEYAKFEGLSHPKQAIAFLAKRFAAKEAAVKALGTGIADGVSFQHIEVSNLASGQPMLILDVSIQARLPDGAIWHISLTDEKLYAQAFVIIETS